MMMMTTTTDDGLATALSSSLYHWKHRNFQLSNGTSPDLRRMMFQSQWDSNKMRQNAKILRRHARNFQLSSQLLLT
eukprot:823056-Amphidinium_carterae.1